MYFYICSCILIFIVATLTKDNDQEDEEVAAEDEEDMGVIETYSNYKPSKLKVTCPIALLSFSYSLAGLQTPVSI